VGVPVIEPPRAVVEIVERLTAAGYETWCVGGAVRDALLGLPNLDWDVATAATPKEVQRLFRRTVPVGVEFGTVGVLDRQGRMHEVTTFRRDVQTDGRHAVVAFGASLDDDLARRDFTINAIAYSPARDELRDPFGGRDDLARGVVRAVGVAEERMREDRLRALRAIRFAARFDFAIEPATWAAIVAGAPSMGRLSAERVKQELEKTMEQAPRPAAAIRLWRESGALPVLAPGIAALPDAHLRALDCLPPPTLAARPQRQLNRLALLFLHAGGDGATRAAKALRFSNADTRWIADLAARWRQLAPAMRARLLAGRPADADVRRWTAAAGRTRVAALLRVASAVWAAERSAGGEAPAEGAVRSLYRRAVRAAYRDPVEPADLALGGDDLLALGVPGGPLVGKILHCLLDRVLDDPALNTREQLAALVPGCRRAAGGGAPSTDNR
jgi:tRNA nucleotidyltransferase (CCA-adding enzyme)